jgi:hypothetical protein
LARGWDLGQSRQPLSPEQIATAQQTQQQLSQILLELKQWLPELSPAVASDSSVASGSPHSQATFATDEFIENIVREVMQQLR